MKKMFLLPLAMCAASAADMTIRNEDAQLLANPSIAGDTAGFAVAASGQTVVLGAYRRSYQGNGAYSGALYIFDREGDGWTQADYIAASDGTLYDYLGWSVDIEGDVIAAGATWAAAPAKRSGAVYVFRRGTKWLEEAILAPEDLPADANFGHDLDLDGSRLIVGAPYIDETVNAQGIAYVFRDDGGTWVQEARLAPGDLDVNFVGAAVAIDGDLAVVGSPRDNGDGISAGSVFIYQRDVKGNWVLAARLAPDDVEPYGYFGNAVAIEGETVLVGAEFSDRVGANAGAVFVFDGSGGSWTQSQVLTADDGWAWSHFGGSLDMRDDVAVVGAYGDPRAAGAAYLFRRGSDGLFTQEARLLASDGELGDRFGDAVAVGADAVVVGASFWSAQRGCGYIFDLGTQPLRGIRRTPRVRGHSYTGTLRSGVSFEYFGSLKGHDYFVTTGPMEYYDAHKSAEVLGYLLDRPANLATINSQEENDFVQAGSLDMLWIGLSDLAVEGKFEWDSGEPLEYTDWGPNDPNRYGGTEDVVAMNWPYQGGKDYVWVDWKELHRYAAALIEIDGTACSGDVDYDGDIDGDDLAIMLDAWGDMGGAGDANHDGAVDVADLLWLLWNWGACP